MRLTEFRPIPGYEDAYEVNPLGMVWSRQRSGRHPRGGRRRIPGGFLSTSGGGRYPQVQLFKNGRAEYRYLHHIVAEVFIGPRPDGMEVCHRNGDASDPRLSNLRYDTPSANNLDKVRHGTVTRGERSPVSKLSEDEVRSIFSDRRGQYIIAAEYGISQSRVSAIKSGDTWSHLNLKETA